ncbi:uncharacterized protein SPAPADRAFT_143089 [Spathaspora passalidarum NRRL Y-27907]|uniref:Uncharacterized protein n=1 Tax=Spathaspora passalidarum (strain NRRL Y-27907 / 11-Y1) TaxID=619300 RepID=G3AUD5_SPAPN|nr:uncharacterized protein SPAPADRAFT_143089 [Spathaspora passalidarum NRRL Y-27907]EGW30511.1 hypothetical protein SPAPADRAFT_143089 [Spathaspora passalidarum NRRL Y-27907]
MKSLVEKYVPQTFTFKVSEQEHGKTCQYINGTGILHCDDPSGLSNTTVYGDYHKHPLSLYSSLHQFTQCEETNTLYSLNISKPRLFIEDFNKMAAVLVDQLKNDDAFKDLSPFFQGKIPRMIRTDTVSKHFFKFAATSVWLEEHRVHFMVSRVLFSRTGVKWVPQLSLLYAETFNQNWEPVDFELKVQGETMKFPSFLPIPFYHNVKHMKKRWYGPEDARILLVKNEDGKDEPLVIFNAHHRRFNESYIEQHGPIPFIHYRSMFIAWPFRFELGKKATDSMPDQKYNTTRFNKARELRIEGKERQIVEKNWTPFIDTSERTIHDSHLHIVYDWEYLQVLKCQLTNLTSDSMSYCKVIFTTPGQGDVGPIRGGTELIPLSQVSTSTAPVWVGFLRTHILKCGCGREMYRPHLVVFRRHGDNFKVSHLSSSLGLDVPIQSARYMSRLCTGGDPNILMPNGISTWVYDKNTDTDYLTLSMSTGDVDNLLIDLKNIGKLVETQLEIGQGWSNDAESSLNMNACVLESSVEFCWNYGDEIKKEFLRKVQKQERKKRPAKQKQQQQQQKQKQQSSKQPDVLG